MKKREESEEGYRDLKNSYWRTRRVNLLPFYHDKESNEFPKAISLIVNHWSDYGVIIIMIGLSCSTEDLNFCYDLLMVGDDQKITSFDMTTLNRYKFLASTASRLGPRNSKY